MAEVIQLLIRHVPSKLIFKLLNFVWNYLLSVQSVLNCLRASWCCVARLDIYRKVPKDLTQPTVTGAIISVCCCSFMVLLLVCELWYFVSPEV